MTPTAAEQALYAAARADSVEEWVRKLREYKMAGVVVIPFDTAQIVRRVCLPKNPNRARTLSPDARSAINDFIDRYDGAACDRREAPDL